MYNTVTLVDNSIPYNWNLVELKCSHQKKKKNPEGDGFVNLTRWEEFFYNVCI